MNDEINNEVEEVTAEQDNKLDSIKPPEELHAQQEVQQDLELDNPEQSLDKNDKQEQETEIHVEISQVDFQRLKLILEALLMASDKPLTVKHITDILTNFNEDHNTRVKDKVTFTKKYISLALDELMTDYAERSLEIKCLGTGYRIQTKAEYAPWVQGLWQEKPGRYSKATLETLAIIAYRQPITRGEIEHIRGVAVSSHIMRNLLDRDWVKVVGHRELPGRPAIYATTPQFLSDLNLEKLEDLPTLADIKEIKQDLFAGLEEQRNPLADISEVGELKNNIQQETKEHQVSLEQEISQDEAQEMETDISTELDIDSQSENDEQETTLERDMKNLLAEVAEEPELVE